MHKPCCATVVNSPMGNCCCLGAVEGFSDASSWEGTYSGANVTLSISGDGGITYTKQRGAASSKLSMNRGVTYQVVGSDELEIRTPRLCVCCCCVGGKVLRLRKEADGTYVLTEGSETYSGLRRM